MLLVGLGGVLVAGCDDGATTDGDVSGSEGNLKGGRDKPKPEPKDEDEDKPGSDDAKPGDELPSPCAAVLCPADSRCVVETAQCFAAPCPAAPRCVPIEEKPPVATCAVTLCKQGTTCVETPEGAQCVDQGTGGASCAATLCKVGTLCVEGPNGAECVEPSGPGCAAVLCREGTTCVEGPKGAQCIEQEPKCTAKCSANQHCELQEVQCVRAPCPPIPTCVDNVDQCAAVRCKSGTHCQVTQIQCFTTPCDPIVECVPN